MYGISNAGGCESRREAGSHSRGEPVTVTVAIVPYCACTSSFFIFCCCNLQSEPLRVRVQYDDT